MHIIKIASGAKFSLYERADNNIGQVREYISTLAERDQKQVYALLRHILKNGPPINEEKFRHLGDKIYELKTGKGVRILCFYGTPLLRDSLILTHGFHKPKQTILMREKEKTLKFRYEYFNTANKLNNFNIAEGKGYEIK